MVSCPKCGTEVISPVKTWPIPVRKPLRESERQRFSGLAHALFDCPKCKARFEADVGIDIGTNEIANVGNMVERIKFIKGELGQTLANLRGKIGTLETERANLMTEIGKLRKVAESRINVLEREVDNLRGEVRSFKDFLGYQEKRNNEDSRPLNA